MASKKKRMTIHQRNGYWVLDLGEVEIWDGADLALLRETLNRLIATEGRRLIGIDLTYVKYIPSGFFGMLFDWHEQGTSIRLYSPQEHVKNMLWFRQFFDWIDGDCYKLMREERASLVIQTEPEWCEDIDWGFEDEPESLAAARER